MRKAKSNPLSARFRYINSGEDIFVYEAEVPLECCNCKRTIEPGELFSRSADKKGLVYGIRYTHCRQCVPFEPVLQAL